jgi:hypothetical protein
MYKTESGFEGSRKMEHNEVQEGETVIHVDNEVVNDKKGEAVKIETNILEKK